MKKVVVTNPTHDAATRYLDMWIAEVADYINSLHDVEVVRLKGREATAAKLIKTVSKYDPGLVMFNGHGNPSAIIGHDKAELLGSKHTTKNHFIGRIVHAVVCSAAHKLGQELVSIGAKAFIGYKDKFYFWKKGNDTNDEGAKLFLEPALEVSRKICEGNSVKTAFIASQKMYAQNLKKELSANGATEISSALEHNLLNHVKLGDDNAIL